MPGLKNRLRLTGILVGLVLVLVLPGVASAHEQRTVGKYKMVVGFINEPAFAGDKNSLDLTICDGECKYDGTGAARVLTNPIKDAQNTLKAEVSTGGTAPLPLELKARFGTDGKYDGYFYPTKAGDYTFHIYGTIGSDKIDEKFTSKPGGFNAVQDTTALQYPIKLGTSANTSPETIALQQQVKETKDNLTIAYILGALGTVFGVVGLILAAFAFSSLNRATRPAASLEAPEPVAAARNGRGPDAG